MTVSTGATSISIFSEHSNLQGRYWCALLNNDDNDNDYNGAEGDVYKWFNGSSLTTDESNADAPFTWSLNRTRCSVTGLDPNRKHVVALGQLAQDTQGIGITVFLLELFLLLPFSLFFFSDLSLPLPLSLSLSVFFLAVARLLCDRLGRFERQYRRRRACVVVRSPSLIFCTRRRTLKRILFLPSRCRSDFVSASPPANLGWGTPADTSSSSSSSSSSPTGSQSPQETSSSEPSPSSASQGGGVSKTAATGIGLGVGLGGLALLLVGGAAFALWRRQQQQKRHPCSRSSRSSQGGTSIVAPTEKTYHGGGPSVVSVGGDSPITRSSTSGRRARYPSTSQSFLTSYHHQPGKTPPPLLPL